MVKIGWLKGNIFLLAALLLLFSACGAASPSKTAATPPPLDPQIVNYSASVRVQVGQPMSVSVSCQAGEQMIGGGFAANNLFEYAAYIEASYPPDASTWTVTGAAPASYFDLVADVYCLSAPVSLGIQIAQRAGGHVACPRGTRLLSGGFQASQPVAVSYPQENGWSSPSSDQVYALCAAHHITANQVLTFPFNGNASPPGYETRVSCPLGQFATGGGFAGQGGMILSSTLIGPPFVRLSVSAGINVPDDDIPLKVYILCAVLTG